MKKIALINIANTKRETFRMLCYGYEYEFFDDVFSSLSYKPTCYLTYDIPIDDIIYNKDNFVWFHFSDEFNNDDFVKAMNLGLTEWVMMPAPLVSIKAKLDYYIKSNESFNLEAFSPQEQKLVNYMANSRGRIFEEDIQALIWDGEKKSVSVIISNIRKKSKDKPIRIIGNKKLGWTISED